mgnify:CR=1 FL=1
MLRYDVSRANPLLRALVSVASLSRMQTFIVSHLRSRLLVQRSSVSLCYWSVSLGEWKGNTLVLFLARGPMLDREAQQVDDGLRGGRRWRLSEVAERIAQIFCSSADF